MLALESVADAWIRLRAVRCVGIVCVGGGERAGFSQRRERAGVSRPATQPPAQQHGAPRPRAAPSDELGRCPRGTSREEGGDI